MDEAGDGTGGGSPSDPIDVAGTMTVCGWLDSTTLAELDEDDACTGLYIPTLGRTPLLCRGRESDGEMASASLEPLENFMDLRFPLLPIFRGVDSSMGVEMSVLEWRAWECSAGSRLAKLQLSVGCRFGF